MMDSLYSGISGLNTFQKTINTEANNISNVNTIAYKADTVSFADLLYQGGIGKGTSVLSVKKNHDQGELKITSNPFDMALDGKGFFTVQDELTGDNYYTRAGNFARNVDGFLQMPSGHLVQGVSIDTPTVVATNSATNTFGITHTKFLASQNITSDGVLQTINTKSTNYKLSASDSGTVGAGFKTSSSKIRDIEDLSNAYRSALSKYNANTVTGVSATSQTSSLTVPVGSVVDYGDTMEVYIDGVKYAQSYDVSETATLNAFSDQISNVTGLTSSYDSATGLLNINSIVPGKDVTISGAQYIKSGTPTLPVITTTNATAGSGLAAVASIRDALKTAVESAGAEFLEITNSVNLDKQSSLTLTSMQLKLDTLGVSSDAFGTFSSDNGAMYVQQGDNKFLVGKIVTSIFADQRELNPFGNNLYNSTKQSGNPLYAANTSKIMGGAVELSNANFSESLVNMLTFQRAFEGSSKTINTSDELLKTAIQLKR